MKFDVLHNFISPVTGRVLADFNYVLVGNRQGIAIPSPILIDIRLDLIALKKRYNTLVTTDFIVGHPNDEIPRAQVLVNLSDGFMYNTSGTVSTTSTIPIGGLPDLTYTYLWTGNIINRPIEVQTIILDNLPDLTTQYIWRGIAGRPVAVNDLTIVETDLGSALSQLADLAAIVSALANTVQALNAAVSAIEAGLASIGGFAAIALLQAQMIVVYAALAALAARLDNLRLNNILADADVSIYGYRIISLANPVDPQDAATKFYVDNAIGGIPVDATYIIQTANVALPDAQVLASLSTGIIKNTTTTGVLTIGVPGTDYYSPGHPTTLIDDFNLNGAPINSYGNVGVGTLALFSLILNSSTNTSNTAIGSEALYAFTTGADNTAVGQSSLFSFVSGNDNTAVGLGSGYFMTSGDQNSIFGTNALPNITSGSSRNSVFGYNAAQNQNTYNSCLFLGARADASVNNLNNATAIGADAVVGASNSLILGSGCNVGIGTSTPSYLLDVIGTIRSGLIIIGTGIFHVGFQAGSLSSNIIWTLPTTDSTGTQALVSNGSGILSWQTILAGTVTSVSGTTNRITVINGTTTPVIDISASYIGQNSITTLGTITTGTWNGSVIDLSHGGTGNTSFTAYSVLCGGTTSTGVLQNVSGVGSSGQVLTSAGTSALPTWQTPTTGTITNIATGYGVTGGPITSTGTIVLDLTAVTERAYCRVATTANLTSTYSNGSSGVGATLTNSSTQVALSIDGVALSVNDRVLVKNQSTTFQNGIYSVTTVGTGSTNWVLTRSVDFNGAISGSITQGITVWISQGTVNTETLWMETGAGPFTIGTTAITFSGYPGQTSITNLGTISIGTWNGSIIDLAHGGSNANLTAVNAGVAYSTASALAISAAPSVSNEILMGQVGSAPIWSTATYPSNVLPGQLLYGSGLFAISGLATAANGVLVTDASDIPSISSTLPIAVQTNITELGTITVGTWNGSIIDLAHGGSNANLAASNGGIVYSTASAMAILAGTATARQVLLSGSSAAPSWSTATYPTTTTINQILYSSATNTIGGLATANSGVLITNSSGVPSISSTLPLISGGANAALTASNGGIVYSTASALAVLAGTATANQILLSGSSGAPSWSTVTHPATTTVNQLLYSSATNTIAGLATANSAVLLTNGSGVPAWQTLTSNVVTSITGTANQITASASTGAVTLSLPASVSIGTSLGIGSGSNAPLQFAAVNANRKIVFIEVANNDNQVTGLGAPSNGMNFQIPDTGKVFIFYAGTSTTTSQELMRVTAAGTTGNSGCIGINVATPLAGCHVVGGVQNQTSEDTCFRAESSSTSAKIELKNTATNGRLYELQSNNNGGSGNAFFEITDRTAPASRLRILASGNTGIGTAAPDNLLSVNGTADKPGGGSWGSFSDIRLKKIIGEYKHSLNDILKLTPKIYKYEFDNQLKDEDREKERVGIIAQEIEDIFPECIEKMNSRGFEDLRYYDSSPILYAIINAIKELNTKIENLEEKITCQY